MVQTNKRATLSGALEVPTVEAMDNLYTPMDVFAKGSFAQVRKIVRKSDGKLLCRKELNYGRMNEHDLQQLSAEVNILQSMPPNENIVRYYERFVDKKECILYIIMEYCEGGDLTAIINKCRRDNVLLAEESVWNYLTQICLALSDCHAEIDVQGRRKTVILHRDLKPDNIFLARDQMTVKLGDFGLSKALAVAAFTNTYVGTPYYMSPELINGDQYDVKSDIWALGCLIYELCARQPPFAEARTQVELGKLIRDGRIPNLPEGYSSQLNQLVKSMLRQSPKQRPTVEQIKGLEQVKLNMRVIELRKIKDALVAQRDALVQREQQLAEREKALNEREKLIDQKESKVREQRDLIRSERNRMATALGLRRLSCSSDDEDYGEVIPPGGGGGGAEDVENVPPTRPKPETSESSPQLTLSKVASRPSLVPRRPLEERKSMHTLNARMSNCSVMSVDIETPIKSSGHGKATPPVSSDYRRRVATSRSMSNLHLEHGRRSASGSRNSSPVNTRRLFPSASNIGLSADYKAGGETLSSSSSSNVGRRSSCLNIPPSVSPSKRQSHHPSAPNPRPPPAHRNTAPPTIPPSHPTPPTPTDTLAGLPQPRYTSMDEDSLPSPFIKKKTSATPLAVMSATKRPISRAFGSGVVPTRAAPARPTTTRQSLATRLSMIRGVPQAIDEQGRVTRSVTAASTMT